jgi:hypothetical protein
LRRGAGAEAGDQAQGYPVTRAASYAARRSSFTSTSLQAEQAMTNKAGSPPTLGTVRKSFIMLPQHRQRKMGRLSGKTIVIPPMLKLDKRFNNTSVRGRKMVPGRQHSPIFERG